MPWRKTNNKLGHKKVPRPCVRNYNSEFRHGYNIAITNNLINISSTRTILLNELKNIWQIIINNTFPNHIMDGQNKISLKKTNNDTNDKLLYGNKQ